MVSKYERSKDEPYPIVYSTFKAKALASDELVKYYIQDLTHDHVDKAVDLIFKFLFPEETFQRAARMRATNDSHAKYLRKFYEKVFKERVSLACFISGSNELIGLNALCIKTKGIEERFEIETKEISNLLGSLDYAINKFNVFDHFHVDHYLYGVGLCVNTAYRGRKIGTELLKARAPLLKCLHLTVTSTLFTTIASQKAAEAAAYEEKSSTAYEELKLKFPDMDFSEANTKFCKIFALQIRL